MMTSTQSPSRKNMNPYTPTLSLYSTQSFLMSSGFVATADTALKNQQSPFVPDSAVIYTRLKQRMPTFLTWNNVGGVWFYKKSQDLKDLLKPKLVMHTSDEKAWLTENLMCAFDIAWNWDDIVSVPVIGVPTANVFHCHST